MLLRATALSLLIVFPAFAAVSTPIAPQFPAVGAPSMAVTVFDPPPTAVTCAGHRELKVIEAAALHPRVAPMTTPVDPIVVSTDHAPIADPAKDGLETLTFSIDAEGRPIDIRRPASDRAFVDAGASIAALAGWRFKPGAAATGCQVWIPARQKPISEASRATLFEVLAFERRNAPLVIRETLSKAGDCGAAPRRVPKTIAYPDLRRFNDRDLNPAWAAVTYDIDADGVPQDVRVETQGGDPALADAAASAIASSRFQPGKPVKACYGTFAATPRDTPAPPRPIAASFERPGDKCDVTKGALNLPAVKSYNYPSAYAARKVAGWAYLRFDVAPWGQVGNVEVLASEPSAAFGDAARSLLWSAHPAAPAEGYRGCIVPIVYALPDPEPILE